MNFFNGILREESDGDKGIDGDVSCDSEELTEHFLPGENAQATLYGNKR